MAETMKQYMSKTQADYGSGIARPKIEDKYSFKLRNTFSGSDHEDANEHIEKVLEIIDLFHIPNITIDQVMLRAFPMSLTEAASRWLKNKPSGLITTWEDLKTKTRSTETSDKLAAIQAQLNNLGREIKKVNEKVYVAQVRCKQCKGPHYTKNCPLREEGKNLKEAYYKFMSESKKRHEEYSNLIKEIRASTDATIRNQGASIKFLEIQIGSSQGIAAAGDTESENASSPVEVGSPGSVYRPKWGVTNGSLLDTPEACQDLVDHAAPPGYFSELRHMHNEEFLRQYNVNLARQMAMGSELRLRFEQEAKLLRKSIAQVARRDKRIQARELEIKNLEALLETEADIKKVATLQEQVSAEEKLKAAFEEFKQYEDNRVKRRCAKLDARLDALSIDFNEELYPHMLTTIIGRRWVIGHGLRLAVMKCGESLEMRQAFADVVSAGIAKGMSEGLRHGVEHGQAQLNVESIEAYDPEAEAKFVAALQALKDLKYPLLDQLEGLKDAPIDVIMAALYMKSDTEDDAPQYIRDLRPSSSQLTIPVYPEVRDPRNPWAYKEEMKLVDAIAANIGRVEKKKKCRIVCRTHGVGSAHHARSDGVPMFVPTVVPQGLALLLADAATQTEF
nr:hypothetical protein [Tanacetum cinerariifolium]